MKKVVLNKKQVKYLEEVNIVANAADDSLSSFSKAASDTNTTADIQKAKTAGDVNLLVGGPDSSDEQPIQAVNVAPGQTVADAIGDQASDELIRNGSRISVTGDGLGESIVFTKRILKEARLAKIKKEGKVMTKKELTNIFLQ